MFRSLFSWTYNEVGLPILASFKKIRLGQLAAVLNSFETGGFAQQRNHCCQAAAVAAMMAMMIFAPRSQHVTLRHNLKGSSFFLKMSCRIEF